MKINNKEQIINFKARDKYGFDVQDRPYPATAGIPQWWKNLTPYAKTSDDLSGSRLSVKERSTNASAKKCVPMLDALSSGYLISLWADIFVTPSVFNPPEINWRTQEDLFRLHGENAQELPAPAGYDRFVYKYLNTWIPETPPGYSVLVTSPFGYRDLPFHAVPAIIDADKSQGELIFPMWIKSGLQGVVERGVPLIQMTPFKRTDWKATFSYYEEGEFEKIQDKTFSRTLVGHYLKNVWSKKSYK